MEEHFDYMTPRWFERAHIYTGSLGELRYRFVMNDAERTIEAAVYSKVCYEKADDVESRTFTWDEEGTAQIRAWLDEAWAHYNS